MTTTATARQILRFTTHDSIVLITSMSGLVANKGLINPMHNSSKAALVQLARNLGGVGPGPKRRRRRRRRRGQGQCVESGPYRHADGAERFRGGRGADGVLGVREHVREVGEPGGVQGCETVLVESGE